METVGVGLAVVSILFFSVTLGLSIRPQRATPSDRKRTIPAPRIRAGEGSRSIVLRLPEAEDIFEDYRLDLKVSLYKGKKEAAGQEENSAGPGKYRRRLDEYL